MRDDALKLLVREVEKLVTPVPERRSLELMSTFIATTAHTFEDLVSEDMVPGVVNSVARLFAKELWPMLGEPKTVKELLKRIHQSFPASFESYVIPQYFVVRDCPIRDIVERESVRPGWTLCLFARGLLWYFLQKVKGFKAKVEIVKPGYEACLYKLVNAELEGPLDVHETTYEDYLTKAENFFKVLLNGLLEALYKILGEPAKAYLMNAGRFAGYAHSVSLPYVEDLSGAVEVLNAFMVVWEGEVKLSERGLVLVEKKYELGLEKNDLFCSLFYGYLAGLLSGITNKNVVFDNYSCSSEKVIKVE